ncbi:MAG: hypothetical protein BMS9Abin05_1784 [Rhodothermia bacterium]|nr:MAG: hypothetical protein BMS9Abin05_1784 [Rhodothermia bacterium]
MRSYVKPFLISVIFTLTSALAQAQSSHLEQLQTAGIECIGGVLANVESFELDADERAPYLRPALVSHWMAEGRTVYAADSSNVDLKLPRFQYRVDDIGVDVRRLGSGLVERTASVAMRYVLTGPDSQILADNMCRRELVDSLDASLTNSLADARYAETNIQYNEKGWMYRVLEPAIIVGAAVIGTYLFFNLRTKRSDDG